MHKLAVITPPVPTNEYQTAGVLVLYPPQVPVSPAPPTVAPTVVPTVAVPHVTGMALQIRSFVGGDGGVTQVTAKEKSKNGVKAFQEKILT